MLKNFYPEKPEIPFHKTSVEMGAVISYLKLLAIPQREVEIKRMAYIMFRVESGNGNKGINNNYFGIQADSGRWQAKYDDMIQGVVRKVENATGKERLFCAFISFGTSIDFLVDRIKDRGLYIGGQTHLITNTVIINQDDLCTAYYREWVTGSKTYEPTQEQRGAFFSMYKQAIELFN